MRKFVAAGVGALFFAAHAVVGAPPAAAETQNATGGTFKWGVRESLMTYHLKHSGSTQSILAGDGATASTETRNAGAMGTSPAQTYPLYWNFPFVSGTYDSTTNSYTAQYAGFVELNDSDNSPSGGPTGSSPFKNFRFSNPKVEINLDSGVKRLVLDVSPGDDGDSATTPSPAVDNVNFATFPDLATEAVASGGKVAYTDLDSELTAEGAVAFSGYYNEGDPVDLVSTSLTGLAGGGGGGGGTGGTGNGGTSNDTGGTNGSTTNSTTSTTGSTSTGTTSTTNSSATTGPPPPPQGGWFGPPMPPGGGAMGGQMMGPQMGGSQYNPPPWFRPPPPPGYGMMPSGYPPQQMQPQFQQQYAAPSQQPAASVSVTAPAPAATVPPATTQVASSSTLPTRAPRPVPQATGPADGDLVTVGAQDATEPGDNGGIAMFAVVLLIGAGIAYFTTRGVRDAIGVHGRRPRP